MQPIEWHAKEAHRDPCDHGREGRLRNSTPAQAAGHARPGTGARPGAKARTLAEAGAEIAVGDLDVPASIDAAMTGVTTVVLVSPAVPAQELNVVASAARAGVGHVIKATSKASADSPIARRRGQAEIEAGLAASGIPHTLLRSNAYMQNVLALAPAIAADQQLRLRGRQGPHRHGRRPRRRRGSRPDRLVPRRARRQDLLAHRPRTDLQLRRSRRALRSCSAGPSPTASSPSRRTRTP